MTLSGGGARGIAHIGALKAFEEAGIKFDYVTGTSVGSIIGACFAAGKTPDEMAEFAKTIKNDDLIDNRLLKLGNNSNNIKRIVNRFLGEITFDQLKMPFRCVAVDIALGREVVLKSGDIATAVTASSAVPVIFTPVTIEDIMLVDGGLLNNMPADVAKQMGAEVVVSVDLNHNRALGTTSTKIVDQLKATWNIMGSNTVYKGILHTDVMIEPELRIFKSTNISNVDEMIAEGYRATKLKINEIKARLNLR